MIFNCYKINSYVTTLCHNRDFIAILFVVFCINSLPTNQRWWWMANWCNTDTTADNLLLFQIKVRSIYIDYFLLVWFSFYNPKISLLILFTITYINNYLLIISVFFQEVGTFIPRHNSHHLNSCTLWISIGSLKWAPGISSSLSSTTNGSILVGSLDFTEPTWSWFILTPV